MSEQTPNLNLPYIMPSQAQKHVTHNEAIRMLDALVQLSVIDNALSTPPDAPNDGDRYVVGSAATDAWAGKDNQVAAFQDGAWMFFAPLEGWTTWVAIQNAHYVFTGGVWTKAADGAFDKIGINGAAADSYNRIAVNGAATLLNHAGNGHQLTLNKANSGDSANIIFQTGFTGFAEIGLVGNNKFAFKVADAGGNWSQPLEFDADNASTNVEGVFRFARYTVSNLPAANSVPEGSTVFLWDEAGGRTLAFSDGTNWRRVQDRAVVS